MRQYKDSGIEWIGKIQKVGNINASNTLECLRKANCLALQILKE